MKKGYEKPLVLFENFSRSTDLAAICEKKINTQAQFDCGIPFEGTGDFGFDFTIYSDEAVGICNMEPSGEYDRVCYHVPDESYNLFNS